MYPYKCGCGKWKIGFSKKMFICCSRLKKWLFNSGWNHNMIPYKEWFHEYIPLTKSHTMHMGDGRTQQVVGIGTMSYICTLIKRLMFGMYSMYLKSIRVFCQLDVLEELKRKLYFTSINTSSLVIVMKWKVINFMSHKIRN